MESLSSKVTSLRHISFKCLWKFARFVGYLPTNCLIVFDHFLELTLKELKWFGSYPNLIHAIIFYIKPCPSWGFTFYYGVMVKLRIMVLESIFCNLFDLLQLILWTLRKPVWSFSGTNEVFEKHFPWNLQHLVALGLDEELLWTIFNKFGRSFVNPLFQGTIFYDIKYQANIYLLKVKNRNYVRS